MRFAVFTTLPGMARIGLLGFADDTSATKREETIARYAKLGLVMPEDATMQEIRARVEQHAAREQRRPR